MADGIEIDKPSIPIQPSLNIDFTSTYIVPIRITIHDGDEWKSIQNEVKEIIIASHCCNEGEFVTLDLSRFVNLQLLEVGDECFRNVNEVKLSGLKKLENVVIGKNTFTKRKNDDGKDPNRHFYLSDCEKIKEVKMGRYSFSDFTVCEIANVPSLEVIEMGELDERSCNFSYASLELKSADDGVK